MDAVALVEQAKGLGLTLAIDGDKLNVTGPKTPAAAVLVQQLAQHKPAILAYLAQPAPVAPADDLAFTLADVDALPIDPEPATGDLYDTIGRRLTAAELTALRSRHPEKTIEARQAGSHFVITAIYRAGAQLWTVPSGRRYVVAA